jgi:ABC-type sugar transport system, permease component
MNRKRKNMARSRAQSAILVAVTLLTLAAFLIPLAYGFGTSVKSESQIASVTQDVLPKSPATARIDGADRELYLVPGPGGVVREMAAIDKTRAKTIFADPAAPGSAPYEWKGNWRTLKPVMKLDPHWGNYAEAWKIIDFPRLLKNTAVYAVLNTIFILLSSSFVAYGFARFNFPGKKLAFTVVMGTMILPSAVTLIPTYAIFQSLGWVGTWLPLIVPALFSNAYNVFLLRQFIMGIPQEMDDAARIDGASPIQTLYRIILPQAVPGLVAAGLFNFFYCWNDYFTPLVYLSGKPELYPISVGLGLFSGQYSTHVQLVQAASVMSCIIPIVIFFFTQRFFMQGVVMTGVEK